jgi:polyisoprenoid-binding protein YceI
VKKMTRFAVAVAVLPVAIGILGSPVDAQGRGTPAPSSGQASRITITEGTTARYKVREQLAGISFPSDAVGTTKAVTGAVVLTPDGSVDPSRSKIAVDLRTIQSDQEMRDGYVRDRTLETEKYPMLEFVPKRLVGLPTPLPSERGAQAGFQIVGDMTLHGVTKEVNWNVVATFNAERIAGRATTTVPFATFGLTKPSLARLLSVNDEIGLEIEFRASRTSL